jgi:hypothetical protein
LACGAVWVIALLYAAYSAGDICTPALVACAFEPRFTWLCAAAIRATLIMPETARRDATTTLFIPHSSVKLFYLMSAELPGYFWI